MGGGGVQLPSCVWLFATPWTAAGQASLSLTISWSLPKFMSHWISDAIQSSHPLSPSYPSSFNLSQNQGLFKWVSSSHPVAKGLEFQLQHQSFQWILSVPLGLTGLISLLPRVSQESSPTSQFKSINSLVLCLLYSPTLTTIRDHWEDHSLDYTDLPTE